MTVPLVHFEGTGKEAARLGLAHTSICPYGSFRTKDGDEVIISIQNKREWLDFAPSFLKILPYTEGQVFEQTMSGS